VESGEWKVVCGLWFIVKSGLKVSSVESVKLFVVCGLLFKRSEVPLERNENRK